MLEMKLSPVYLQCAPCAPGLLGLGLSHGNRWHYWSLYPSDSGTGVQKWQWVKLWSLSTNSGGGANCTCGSYVLCHAFTLKKILVSCENVLDKAVKIISFTKFQLWRPRPFITCHNDLSAPCEPGGYLEEEPRLQASCCFPGHQVPQGRADRPALDIRLGSQQAHAQTWTKWIVTLRKTTGSICCQWEKFELSKKIRVLENLYLFLWAPQLPDTYRLLWGQYGDINACDFLTGV